MNKTYRWIGLMGVIVIMLVAMGVPSLSAFQSYQDSFGDDDSGWKEDFRWTYTEGQYRVFVRNPNTIDGSEMPDGSVFDLNQYCAEVDIKLLTGSGLAEDGFIGFYIGGTDIPRRFSVPGRAVLFGLDSFERLIVLRTDLDTSNGRVSLDVVTIIGEAFENPNAFHTLQVDANGSNVRVSIDDVFITSVSVNTVGNMGFMAFTFDDPNLNARFDNISVTPGGCTP